jgi:hypothetical protein
LLCNNSITSIDNTQLSLYLGYKRKVSSGDNLRRSWPFLYSATSDSLYRSFKNTFEASGKVRTRVYIQPRSYPHAEFEAYPPAYRQLVIDQTTVGWGHLIAAESSPTGLQLPLLPQHGQVRARRMALNFFPFNVRRLSHCVDSSQWRSNWTTATVATPPSSWHRTILHPMLVNYHTLRTLCNGKRHGTNKKAQRINRLAQLERDLQTIYKYDTKVLASNEDLFDNPIDKLLTFPPNEIEK